MVPGASAFSKAAGINRHLTAAAGAGSGSGRGGGDHSGMPGYKVRGNADGNLKDLGVLGLSLDLAVLSLTYICILSRAGKRWRKR